MLYAENYLFYFLIFIFVFLLFLWAAPVAYGGSRARGRIGVAAASLHRSHSNAGSFIHWRRQRRVLNPLRHNGNSYVGKLQVFMTRSGAASSPQPPTLAAGPRWARCDPVWADNRIAVLFLKSDGRLSQLISPRAYGGGE